MQEPWANLGFMVTSLAGPFLFLAGAGLLKFLRVRVSATNSVQSQKLDFELVIVKIRKAGSGSSPKSPAILMLTLLQVP